MCIVAGDIYYKDFNLIKHETSAGSNQERYSEGLTFRPAFIGSGEHVTTRSSQILVAETIWSFMQELAGGTKYKMVDMLREVVTNVEVIWLSA